MAKNNAQSEINRKRLNEPPSGAKFSGDQGIPRIGEVVDVTLNGIGLAEVTGYTEEYGYVGVVILPQNPPEWYARQNGEGAEGVVFGTEFQRIKEVR